MWVQYRTNILLQKVKDYEKLGILDYLSVLSIDVVNNNKSMIEYRLMSNEILTLKSSVI